MVGRIPRSVRYLITDCGDIGLYLSGQHRSLHLCVLAPKDEEDRQMLGYVEFRNKKSSKLGKLPSCVTHLNASMKLSAGSIPSSVTNLTFGDCKYSLQPGDIPNSVTILDLSGYSQAIPYDVIPNSVKNLTFGSGYHHMIGPGLIPSSVIRLIFSSPFKQSPILLDYKFSPVQMTQLGTQRQTSDFHQYQAQLLSWNVRGSTMFRWMLALYRNRSPSLHFRYWHVQHRRKRTFGRGTPKPLRNQSCQSL